ncbi:MAG: DUF4369 domain-containing protein [Prevotella sp.]|nr:DUF4369 domain-containing protein [Prevotella sp.]
MRKFLFLCMALGAMMFVGCQKSKVCQIHGTVVGEQYEGKRIFLVPFSGPATAETVDSIEIKDGKFEFTPDSIQMYKILLDYHYRFGTQPLIVVAEPGDIMVTIDTISSAVGTPQNDSLQVWKELTEKHQREYGALMRLVNANVKQNDTIEATKVKEQAQKIHIAYKNRTRAMAANMEGTILGSFLKGMFPRTYQRKMPDGTTIEIDADTNGPVK